MRSKVDDFSAVFFSAVAVSGECFINVIFLYFRIFILVVHIFFCLGNKIKG